MQASTHALHTALIRCLKGMTTAWEKWLRDQGPQPEQGKES